MCPVCLGVKMDKVMVGDAGARLALDACRRCGGVWFELGEVQRIRRQPLTALMGRLPMAREDVRTLCHGCHAPLDRNAEQCAACGESNHLDCPSCSTRMLRQQHGAIVLDVCASCKGVWFDRSELQEIWKLEVDRALAHQQVPEGMQPQLRDVVLLDALFWAPDLMFYGMVAGADVAGATVTAIGSAPEAAAGAAEVVGEAAGGLFETIAEIIGNIFN